MGCGGSTAKASPSLSVSHPPPVVISNSTAIAGAPPPQQSQAPPASAPPVSNEVPPSTKKMYTDAEILELRKLTPVQAAAAKQAAEHIKKVYNRMKKVQPSEYEQHWHRISDNVTVSWGFFRGALIEDVMKHTPLVDLEYIVELTKAGGVMPCGRQHVPKEAFITVDDNLWRLKCWNKQERKFCLGILVLSYPWLDFFHPDRNGAQLTRLLPFLQCLLSEAKKDSPYCTIGVMIDFLCLPQKPFTAPEQKDQFTKSLMTINEWYYHPNTYVLLVTSPPPQQGGPYTSTRLHKDRGWCFFEKAAAMCVKKAWCLLDWSAYQGSTRFGVGGIHTQTHNGGDTCVAQMIAARDAPISPPIFSKTMRDRVDSGELTFTAAADKEFVIGQYEKGFVHAINIMASSDNEMTRTLPFHTLKWTDREAEITMEAIRYAAPLCTFPHGAVGVYLEYGNNLSADMKKKIDKAFSSEPLMQGRFYKKG